MLSVFGARDEHEICERARVDIESTKYTERERWRECAKSLNRAHFLCCYTTHTQNARRQYNDMGRHKNVRNKCVSARYTHTHTHPKHYYDLYHVSDERPRSHFEQCANAGRLRRHGPYSTTSCGRKRRWYGPSRIQNTCAHTHTQTHALANHRTQSLDKCIYCRHIYIYIYLYKRETKTRAREAPLNAVMLVRGFMRRLKVSLLESRAPQHTPKTTSRACTLHRVVRIYGFFLLRGVYYIRRTVFHIYIYNFVQPKLYRDFKALKENIPKQKMYKDVMYI